MGLSKYIFNILITLDELVNAVVLGGMPDETISARCYRERFVSPTWEIFRRLIDAVAFHVFGVDDHCEMSYRYEERHRTIPRIYRR